MAAKDTNPPSELDEQATTKGLAELLSPEDVANLAGFFDVLVEMDFETKQRNEQKSKDDRDSDESRS